MPRKQKDTTPPFDVMPRTDVAPQAGADLAKLPPPERARLALKSESAETELRALIERTAAITNVVDDNGREEAHRAAMTLRGARTSIEKTGKAAREDAQAFSKAVIAEEKRLLAITEGEEARVFKLRDDYDERVRLEREAIERAEAERQASISAAIDALRSLPAKLAGAGSAMLREELTRLADRAITVDEFGTRHDEALLLLETVGSSLAALLDGALEREAEVERRLQEEEAERKRVADQKAENERAAAALAEERAALARQVAAQEAARLADEVRERQQQAAMAEIKHAQDYAAKIGTDSSAYDLEFIRSIAAAIETSTERHGMASGTVAMSRDLAVMQLQTRITALVAEELPQAWDEAISFNRLHDAWNEALDIDALYSEELPGGQHYSRNTFKENGLPILLTAENTRSVFCDLCDDMPEPAPEPIAAAPTPALPLPPDDADVVAALRAAVRDLLKTRNADYVYAIVADELRGK